MAVTLDTLELKIQSSSTGASSGIRSLADSLRDLISPTSNAISYLKELDSVLNSIKANTKGLNLGKILNNKSANGGLKKEVETAVNGFNTLSTEATKAWQAVYTPPVENTSWNGFKNALPGSTGELSSFVRNVAYGGVDKSSAIEAEGWVSTDTPRLVAEAKEAGEQVGQAYVSGFTTVPNATERVNEYFSRIREERLAGEEARRAKWNEIFAKDGKYIDENGVLRELQKETDAASEAMGKMGESSEEAGTGLKGVVSHVKELVKGSALGKLGSQIGRIAKTMAIRAAIRGLIKSVKEGISNLYGWSDAVNGHFASAMDKASSQFMLMKNSVGSAIGPLLEAVLPVFNSIASAVNDACNALAQFFALLNGSSSWTKATLSAEKYGKATKGAGSATKDLLADWDELNIIQSQGGGGGGGSGSTNYTDMFEEQFRFDEKIRDLVEFIQDHLDQIKATAIAIGGAILAWKLSNGFMTSIDSLKALKSGITVAVGLAISIIGSESLGESVGEGGFDFASLVEMIGGWVVAGIGGAGLASVIGVPKWTGAGIAITLAAVISVAAFFKGLDEGQKNKLYGSFQASAEDIAKKAREMFGSFDIEAHIKSIRVVNDNYMSAKNDLEEKVKELERNVVSLDVSVSAPDESKLASLVQSVNAVIDSIESKLKTENKSIKMMVDLTSGIVDENGAEISLADNSLAILEEVGNTIQSGVNGIGERIAGYWDEGIRSGWKNGEAALIQEEAARLLRIERMGQEYADKARTQAKITANFAGTDVWNRDSVKSLMEENMKLTKEYENEVVQNWKNNVEIAATRLGTAQGLLDEAMKAGNQADIETYSTAVKEAQAILDEWMAPGYLEKYKEDAMKQFRGDLSSAYTDAFGDAISGLNFRDADERWAGQIWGVLAYKLGMADRIDESEGSKGAFLKDLFGGNVSSFLGTDKTRELLMELNSFASINGKVAPDMLEWYSDIFGMNKLDLVDMIGWDNISGGTSAIANVLKDSGFSPKEILRSVLEDGSFSLNDIAREFSGYFRNHDFNEVINEIINDPSFKRDIVEYGFDNTNRNPDIPVIDPNVPQLTSLNDAQMATISSGIASINTMLSIINSTVAGKNTNVIVNGAMGGLSIGTGLAMAVGRANQSYNAVTGNI